MKKIVIIGISGTGKSILGQRMAEKTGLPLHHMDPIIWNTNWIEAEEESIHTEVAKIVATESWIVEGWIDSYSRDILQRAELIIYLDYSGWLATWGGIKRWWRYKGKKRPEMPSGCVENFDLRFLQKILLKKERPHIEAMIEKNSDLNIIRVRSRSEMEKLFSKLVPKEEHQER